MNQDERRAFKAFEKEYMVRVAPDKWEEIKRTFCQQRSDRNGKPSQGEIVEYLMNRGIGFELASK